MKDQPSKSSPRTDSAARAWVAAAVPAEVYDEIASALTNPDSPVGIDARHTHVLILHALDRIERRLDAAASADVAAVPGVGPGVADARALSTRVRELVARSRVGASLDPVLRRRIEAGITRSVALAAGEETRAFPGYVADLLDGVFDAIVDVSIQQMEAYADLLEGAGKEVDGSVDDSGTTRRAAQRQRLLATMVLMGVNRLVVTRGRVRVRSVFDANEEDDDDD